MNSGCLTCRFCVGKLLIFEVEASILLVVYEIERYLSEDSSHNTPPWGFMTLHFAYNLVSLPFELAGLKILSSRDIIGT